MTAGVAVSSGPPRAVRALVIFGGRADVPWLRILRPGFRHCFVVLRRQGRWIAIDPMLHRTDVLLLPVADTAEIAARYRRYGMTVIETRPRLPARRAAPWAPFTCVEMVKRVLGIHARWVLTPWQLHRFLARSEKTEKNP